MINEAIDFLRNTLPEKPLVGFSGGKDSIVIAKLMELSGLDHTLVYNHTGIDLPEVVRFIFDNYPNCRIVKPNRTFWHYITTHNPPLFNFRWCCKRLKKEPSEKLGYKYQVMGIRAEESVKRSKYERINVFKNRIQFYPILNWNQSDVWGFINDYDLKYPNSYDKYELDRLGCVICPMHSKRLHKIYRGICPQYFDLFERKVYQWFYKRIDQGRTMNNKSPQDFLKDWYAGKARWY